MIDDKGQSAVAVFTGKVNAEAKLADGSWSNPMLWARARQWFAKERNLLR